MSYSFDVEKFKKTFKVQAKSEDELRLFNNSDELFHLFPYTVNNDNIDLENVIYEFFRKALKENESDIAKNSKKLIDKIKEKLSVEEKDTSILEDIINKLFFVGNCFRANNIKLYPYQTPNQDQNSSKKFADFLFSVFDLTEEDCEKIQEKVKKCNSNILEDLVYNILSENQGIKKESSKNQKKYFLVKNNIQEKFKEDLNYMIDVDMTSIEDLLNLFELYFCYYISQTCITLDSFCDGKRDTNNKIYFALDWEKVSKNRLCRKRGFKTLQESIECMMIHAVTLEILNQNDNKEKWDYIEFREYIKENPSEDEKVAEEIKKAENTYKEYIEKNIAEQFDKIRQKERDTYTEKAIRHLYDCVKKQFNESERKSVPKKYSQEYSDFCQNRWGKNRKKAGWVLNLTESDIIFLNKICLKRQEKILLNDLYKSYEDRGIYLDKASKESLQEFLIRLNLIDKKSDSGDAQYVKRIL